MVELFDKSAFQCSKIITNLYSTSFSIGIKTLDKKFHNPIYAIYGFVRYADEIVDTFHDFDKEKLLAEFREATFKAIQEEISLNPVLNAFQKVVRAYSIDEALITAFLDSMEMDLGTKNYERSAYTKYIYGSAEAVGLMCLKVFTEGDKNAFERLKEPAKRLGAAFQKVNFLRDIQSDYVERGRTYFPGIDFLKFSEETKRVIEREIKEDFEEAYKGIIRLPAGAKMGVYLSYIYYQSLFNKICRIPSSQILKSRIRVSDNIKLLLLIRTYIHYNLKVI